MEVVNRSTGFRTDYDLWEYLLVAHPDAEANEKIVMEKQLFHTLHDHQLAANSKPHISIANFLLKEIMEDTIVRWMQNIFNLHTSFSVTLNNYSGFPPHSIFLRVQDPQPFKKLASSLKILDGFIQSNDCPPLQVVTRPHLTIAGGLPEYIYDKAIREYAQRSFHASFTVDRLALLKRDASMKCHLVHSFVLPAPLTLFE